jgi:hypothetical protein
MVGKRTETFTMLYYRFHVKQKGIESLHTVKQNICPTYPLQPERESGTALGCYVVLI